MGEFDLAIEDEPYSYQDRRVQIIVLHPHVNSGGPLFIQRADKRFLLAGVISCGINCAEPNQLGVYTRISEFR